MTQEQVFHSHLKRIVVPNEVRDLQFAVEENHASPGTLRNNSLSHLILGGAAVYRCDKHAPEYGFSR
jgi:hypothetical protein